MTDKDTYMTDRANPTEILKEFQITARTVLDNTKCTDCADAVEVSRNLLDMIERNIFWELDAQLLAEMLTVLSDLIQSLQTVFQNDRYENTFGMATAHKFSMQVRKLLQKEQNSAEKVDTSQNFILKAVSQIPVTNITLALWKDSTFRYYGLRVDKQVKQALKAMYVYDQLLGNGICELLLNNTQDKVEKKLKAFDDVGLHSLTKAILEFYSCKTGNEKKRFLTDVEGLIGNTDIIKIVNDYLTNL